METVCLKDLHLIDVNLQLIRENGQIKGPFFITLVNLEDTSGAGGQERCARLTWSALPPRAGRY